ncbi:TonB-dependent receptor [candidate division KSB1 bacterium]|nr:TonB-dependent receptor [candidate division KSB1 bacterium]
MQWVKAVFWGSVVAYFLGSSSLMAGTTGKIAGRVVDEATGLPLPGANVIVLGTTLGAMSDLEGSFFIINVKPGKYSVKATMMGYSAMTITEARVNIDLTTNLEFKLKETVLDLGEEVIIVAEKPLVQLDLTSHSARISKEDIDVMPVSNIKEILRTQTGFKVDSRGNIHIRGGRADETLFVVDGMAMRDPLDSRQTLFDFSNVDIEEIEILTGGFSAEYGRVQSGIINITTPEGSDKRYFGGIDYSTDMPFDKHSFDSDRLEFSLGGFIPYSDKILPNKLTFYFSGSAYISNTYTPFTADGHAPVGVPDSDLMDIGVELPQRQSTSYKGNIKLTYKLTDSQKLTLKLSKKQRRWDNFYDSRYGDWDANAWRYKYNPESRPFTENEVTNIGLIYTNQLSSRTFFEVTLRRYNNQTSIKPRGKDPGQFTMYRDREDYVNEIIDRNFDGVLNYQDILAGDGDIDQLITNGFYDGYVDANGNEIYDGWGEGYEDLNGNGCWDRGEDWIDVNGSGVYDYAEPFVDVPDPATGRNNLGVYDPWDPFTDLNGNGIWDPAEPQLPEQDWNHNGRWDGERFQDANGNGYWDGPFEDLNGNGRWDVGEPVGYSEGYDDRNFDGSLNVLEFAYRTTGSLIYDPGEPYLDGDMFYDTGEPFIDSPDPITGLYNGVWDPGEFYLDLPSSYTAPGFNLGIPTLNGQYDGPNGFFDEYELFTRPAGLSQVMDPRFPIYYSWDPYLQNNLYGEEWMWGDYLRYDPLHSTWHNRTTNDEGDPVFNSPNYRWDEGEWFEDYNRNGIWNGSDQFLNPGVYDPVALWHERETTEYNLKFDLTSQASKYHEIKAGAELIYRDMQMQDISYPGYPYTGDAVLPPGSPWPDRGAVRDFYRAKPWEGAVYFTDKMEFQGMILRAGLRFDFVIHDPDLIKDYKKRHYEGEIGSLREMPRSGVRRVAPRLGISHPITSRSKLYFNYGHFFQPPDYRNYYKSNTAGLNSGIAVGNPNLKYIKTVMYELGVSSQIRDDFVFDISGFYKDKFNEVGVIKERVGNFVIPRYYNSSYGRGRGVELSAEKRLSNFWRAKVNYTFMYAQGKESEAVEELVNPLSNVPENTDEHPLDWDELHGLDINASLIVGKGERISIMGIRMPSNWLLSVSTHIGSGYPYTPSKYTEEVARQELITPNSARKPWTETTDLMIEKYFMLRNTELTLGLEVHNLFNKKNVAQVFGETGSPTQRYHPDNPDYYTYYSAYTDRTDYDHNPRNFEPPRQILVRLKWSF